MTVSNIYDGAFLGKFFTSKATTYFCKKLESHVYVKTLNTPLKILYKLLKIRLKDYLTNSVNNHCI